MANALFDSIQELVAQIDRDGTIRAVNRRWREKALALGGRSLLRRVGIGANYLAVCARAAAAGDEPAAAALGGIERVLSGELSGFDLEYACPSPERAAWFRLRVSSLGKEGEGALVVHSDITARRQAEEELAASEEWQQRIFEASSDLISTHSRDSAFVFVSAACRPLLGYEAAELVGRRVIDMVHPEDMEAANATHRRLLAGSDVETIVCRYRRKDGLYVWVEAVIHMLQRGAPSDIPFLCISRDISQRREAERQQRMLREAHERAAREWATTFDAIRSPILVLTPAGRILRANLAAHELAGVHSIVGRTLASVVQGEPWDEAAILLRRLLAGADLGTSEVRDEESGRCWQIEASLAPASEGGGTKVILWLRDVTDIVRLRESLRRSEVLATLQLLPADLVQTVEEALSLCRPLARQRRVALEADIGGDWSPVAIDRERLVLAVKNVVDNAVRHAPAGSAVRVITRRASLADGEWLQIRVEDSGSGFAPEDLPNVFEPFFSRRAGGSGLGLSLVAQVVEAHGGRVRAENRDRGGAAVELWLPLEIGGVT